LKQVDCLCAKTRLVVEGEDRKIARLLLAEPEKVAIIGGGSQTLSCGPQKARRVTIDLCN